MGPQLIGAAPVSCNSHKSYRPLTVLTFRLDASWYGRDSPEAAAHFRRTSAYLHAVVTLLVFHLARRVTISRKFIYTFLVIIYHLHGLVTPMGFSPGEASVNGVRTHPIRTHPGS